MAVKNSRAYSTITTYLILEVRPTVKEETPERYNYSVVRNI